MNNEMTCGKNIIREILTAVRCEKDHCKIEEDEGAFVYAYKQGYLDAIRHVEKDIDLIVKRLERMGFKFMVPKAEVEEMINACRRIKERDEALDPDTPGYTRACEELVVYLQDITGWRVYGAP